jgi:hypothetical protein
LVDSIAFCSKPNSTELDETAESTRRNREKVNNFAFYALSFARHGLIDFPIKRMRVENAYEALSKIVQYIEMLQQVTPFDMSYCGAAWATLEQTRTRHIPAEDAFRNLLIILQGTGKMIQSTVADYPLLPPPVTANMDFLANGFLRAVAVHWKEVTGAFPSASASGPFIRFVAAAWADLGFPTEDQRGKDHKDDLAGWLGEKWVKYRRTIWKPGSKKLLGFHNRQPAVSVYLHAHPQERPHTGVRPC